MRVPPEQRCFYLEELGDCLKLPAEVARVSTCELELDAVAADILNHHDLTGAAMNPGLVALWENERIRREREGVEDPLTDPPPRPDQRVCGREMRPSSSGMNMMMMIIM